MFEKETLKSENKDLKSENEDLKIENAVLKSSVKDAPVINNIFKPKNDNNNSNTDNSNNVNSNTINDNLYYCPRCLEGFKTTKLLLRHIKRSIPCDFLCHDCGKKFASRTSYSKHTKSNCEFIPSNFEEFKPKKN